MISIIENYNKSEKWSEKAILMEIYYLTTKPKPTIKQVASFFNVSTGLVCENLRLARVIHEYEKILECPNRVEALKIADRRKHSRYKI